MSLREAIKNATDEEKAEALRELMQFPLGQRTFEAWCETGITCPMEYCILLPGADEILLHRRPDSDPFYAGQLHVTGGILLPGEHPDEVWERLTTSQKYGLTEAKLSRPFRIGVTDTPMGPQVHGCAPRGQERNIIHVSFYIDGPIRTSDSRWFSIRSLPRTGPNRVIGHHLRYIDAILMPWLGMSVSEQI